ncbi:hypothetical protein KTS45_07550 [Halomicroarcula limicola]|uniref:Uncharacterized protein n=1 Tax=Haloarcula limicola TaxID=1429915 RepID=A0A8J8C392_9EURY|nr:DUF6498-containing protein [Halomicroarcula limicola]MBV0924057.1 hypothetical protein [Halomicroarcula limicola]
MTGRRRFRHAGGLLSILVANLYPLVGVAALDWSLGTVLVLYWVEMGVVAVWAGARALFAERQSAGVSHHRTPLRELREKRGGVTLWSGGPPAYLRNVPFTVGLAGVFLFIWLCYGGFLLLQFDLAVAPTGRLVRTVALGGIAMFVGRGVEFVQSYLGEAEYEDVSGRMVVATPARHALLVILLMPVLGSADGLESTGLFVAAALVVVAKLGYEVFNYRADRVGDRTSGLWARVFGPRDTSAPPPVVETPAGTPDDTVRPSTPGVLVGGVLPGLSVLASRPGYVAVIAAVFGLFWLPALAVAVLALVSLLVAGKIAVHYAVYGTVEYRRYGDAIVAYDRWLDEPQWRIERADLTDRDVPRRLAGRLSGTDVITVRWGEGRDGTTTKVLGPFDDVDDAASRLGLPVRETTEREPNRAVFAAAVGIALTFLVIPVGMVVSAGIPIGEVALLGAVVGPMLLLVLGPLLWVGAMNV